MSSLLSKISEKSAAKSGELPRLISLSLLFFFLVVAMSIKVRLLDFPLERDEGAFSYMAKLVLSGERLYVDGFDFKPPGLYLAYALFMKIFGETAGGIRAGLLVFTGLSVCMFFQISRKMLSPTASLAGTLAFSVFAVSPAFLSHAAHATQVVILPLLLGLWSIFSFFKKPSRALPLIGGVAMGVAFFVKQPALIFGFFGGAFFLFSGYFSGESTKWITVLNAVFYIAGFLIPVFFILAWLSYTTSLSEYWFWNFTYPRDYGTVLGLKEGLSNFRIMFPNVVGNFKGMWLICISGLLFLPFYNKGCKYGVLIGGL
ncbi:MAG: ArnT family glycosyltransferase, partial [Nitrospinota bacterium]